MGKRDKENKKGEKDKKDHWENKINPVVEENSGSKASVYHYIIYIC